MAQFLWENNRKVAKTRDWSGGVLLG